MNLTVGVKLLYNTRVQLYNKNKQTEVFSKLLFELFFNYVCLCIYDLFNLFYLFNSEDTSLPCVVCVLTIGTITVFIIIYNEAKTKRLI